MDIQGPKHRVGMFPNPDAGTKVELKKGQTYTFDLNKDVEGDNERVVSSFLCLPVNSGAISVLDKATSCVVPE